MSQSVHTVQSLQSEVAALGLALAYDQLDCMPDMLVEHDLHLKEYCQSADIQVVRDELMALNAMQEDLIRMMRERQRQILEKMRAHQYSSRAAVAYLKGGRL